MNDEFSEKLLPVHVNRQLDELLGSWAEHVRLSSVEQDDLYNQIFVIKDLDYDWWHQLFASISFKNKNVYGNSWFGKNAV